jgi:Spy/CpxP family protein refolding chaperone
MLNACHFHTGAFTMKASTVRLPRWRSIAVATMLVAACAAALPLAAGAHGGMGMPQGGAGPMAMGAGPMGGPADAGPMSGRMLERMLDSVGATAEQRSQIRAIADAASTDLKAQRDAGLALRQQAMQLFAQPDVDAGAVEAQRQKMLQHHDQVSRRMTQAMLDVSRVLTPEQRAQWAQRMTQRQEMMERHQIERMQWHAAPRS